MLLTKISLVNFRNINQLNLSLDNPLTILYGENGQGKTNIMESIYLLSNASSFRTSYYREMIQNNMDEAIITGEIDFLKKRDHLKMILKKSGKTAFINDVLIQKVSDYIGKFNVICFSPEDVSLFKDSPSVRRHFLDKELSSLFPVYIKQLIIFKSVLEERNILLKGNIDLNLLEVIDDKLIESSYDIYKRRKWLISKIEEFATKIYKKLTNEAQQIKIVYQTFLDEYHQDNYLAKGKEIYKKTLSKDKEKYYTTVGIHKDDFKVYLNEMEIDMYASQGQQRLISLSMKLAVAEIISKAIKREPLILLDDAFSEIDTFKKEKLLEYVLKKEQVLITCTDYKNLIHQKQYNKITLLHVKEGKIAERSTI